jgi:hypothetical protein
VKRAFAAALVAAAVLAGCGGSSDTPKIQTKDDYIAAGDNVCAGLGDRFATAGATDPQTPKQIVDSADVLANLYGDLTKGLEGIRLPPRPADSKGAGAYVSAVRRTGPALAKLRSSAKSLQDAVAAKDQRKVALTGNDVRKALDEFRAAQAQGNQLARDYGFNLCGNLN